MSLTLKLNQSELYKDVKNEMETYFTIGKNALSHKEYSNLKSLGEKLLGHIQTIETSTKSSEKYLSASKAKRIVNKLGGTEFEKVVNPFKNKLLLMILDNCINSSSAGLAINALEELMDRFREESD